MLRQKYKETFENKFGIELELVCAPGPQNAGRAAAEFKAGVRYFDVLHGGSGTLEPLMYDDALAPFSDYLGQGRPPVEKVRFYGEDIITNWREPAGAFARKILKKDVFVSQR